MPSLSKLLLLIAVPGLAREEVALHVTVTVKIKRALPQIELACRGERDPFIMKEMRIQKMICFSSALQLSAIGGAMRF